MQLVVATGFAALDAGTPDESWRQQPVTPDYCTKLTVDELKFALAGVDKGRAPTNRKTLINEFIARYGG